MRHYNRWLIGIMTAVMLSGCSNEVVAPENNEFKGGVDEEVFLSLSIQLPDGKTTRSITNGDNSSSGGVEVGTAVENNVTNVLLVLADENNAFIAGSVVSGSNLIEVNGGGTKAYQALSRFTKTDLDMFYQNYTGTANPLIKVFVYVNMVPEVRRAIMDTEAGDTEWVNLSYKLTSENDETLWSPGNDGKGNFVMTNVVMARREIPSSIDKWAPYSSKSHPFDLSGSNNPGMADAIDNLNNGRGSVKVHRMAARFDFKDGANPNVGANTYEVLYKANPDGSQGQSIVNVRLNKMALVNASNQMYYLERTSKDGLPTGADFGILSPELPWFANEYGVLLENMKGNYVIDVYSDVFNTENSLSMKFSDYFWSPFFEDGQSAGDNNNNENANIPTTSGGETRWANYTSLITDVLGGPLSMDNQYHVWRYVAENVIPAPVNNQVNGYSTGVVFKGKLIGTDESKNQGLADLKLFDVLNNTGAFAQQQDAVDPIIYQFNGALYVSWPDIKDKALKASQTGNTYNRLDPLYQAVFGKGGTGEPGDTEPLDINSPNYLWNVWNNMGKPNHTAQLSAFKRAATGNMITLYQPSYDEQDGWGYYCYYYYWNRHNNNGNNGIMGPMEFAVVRNNVYKLSVTKLSQLGHPRIPENDPDNPTPDTPDESEDLYITVTAEVVPWVVRMNEIEF